MDEPSKGILNRNPQNSLGSSSGFPPPIHAPDRSPPSEAPALNVTIKIEEPPEQRGRSRNKLSNARSYSSSRSRTKSRSLGRPPLSEHENLKWTILAHDPSERLHQRSALTTSFAMDEEDPVSDEEQISDTDLDADLDYDLGARVLPNFAKSIQHVLDSQPAWLAAHRASISPQNSPLEVNTLNGTCKRAIKHIAHHRGSPPPKESPGRSFLVYLEDLSFSSAEKLYALTYTFGAVIANYDTLYILVQCDQDDVENHMSRVNEQVEFLLDCTSGVLDYLDVIIVTLHHQYPRHLLTEMIEAFRTVGVVVPLQIATGSLAGYVSSVPTLVVRKKLRRARRRGFHE
ncbi:HHR247Wp [Eremothecium sinecaudum]|uniref:HHR247Wp n=1 Tax=Eremothecium sinecaudum TaxID=45286 RepID=A0A0X8HWY0_9SACH|nr:HHR247Wp [Eremothecium sinecaudum]AMD23016.1 HHR247Wp [Eremothecium sinecaudum]